jgi:hypothetical protein
MTSLTARTENSRRLDVWKWSDHPKVHLLINDAYEYYFRGFKHPRAKQHVKVLLLDLFVAWNEDPTQSIGVSMRPSEYSKNSSYKKIFITQFIIKVVKRAKERGLIDSWEGQFDLERVTRIWASSLLINLFKRYKLTAKHIIHNHQRPSIIIRDQNGDDIDFNDNDFSADDQWLLATMRDDLAKYNSFLEQSFIDIPSAIRRVLKVNRSGKQTTIVTISDNQKYVYRVFNNDSLYEGGRFYGGWWQNLPKLIRQKIFINCEPTVEIDFCGLHINLLYAVFGLSPQMYPARLTPYEITLKIKTDKVTQRKILKQLLLISLNAKNDATALSAFRVWLTENNLQNLFPNLKNATLQSMCLKPLKQKHQAIIGAFATGAGVSLMNADSKIMELIINKAVQLGIVILPMHDSVIVQEKHQNTLQTIMENAFEAFSDDPFAPTKTTHPRHQNKTNRYLARERKWREEQEQKKKTTTITGIAALIL